MQCFYQPSLGEWLWIENKNYFMGKITDLDCMQNRKTNQSFALTTLQIFAKIVGHKEIQGERHRDI